MPPQTECTSTQLAFGNYAERYEAELMRGLRLTGYDRGYFARQRIGWLAQRLDKMGFRANSILDFGCADGASSTALTEIFDPARILGVDTSPEMIEVARGNNSDPRLQFVLADELETAGGFDLVYCSGVLHHVAPSDRLAALGAMRNQLRPRGLCSCWENNTLNPGTRMVMTRVAFDRDAIPISCTELRRLLRRSGMELMEKSYHFVFPRWLRWLRFAEPPLSGLPLGGQYHVLSRKPIEPNMRSLPRTAAGTE